MRVARVRKLSCVLISLGFMNCLLADPPPTAATQPSEEKLRAAIERALPLLERASEGSAEQRTCFTCHSQAMPVFSIVAAESRGFATDRDNLARQLEHTHLHLKSGREAYQAGKGQGGGVDTAGYALWTLEAGERPADETTKAVTSWLLQQQRAEGYWKSSSNRPPSEASNFTTTYLAIRGLLAYGTAEQELDIQQAIESAAVWIAQAAPQDTEDQVFRLLSSAYCELPEAVLEASIQRLISEQRNDGGWSQTDELESDAYATGTALFALLQTQAIQPGDIHWQRGARFLLNNQQTDGSWLVKSRSKPFQLYFETGFPHGKDQFISTSATAWATLALLPGVSE